MCGIAGWLSLEGRLHANASEQLRAMTDAIAHRGPDAQGQWLGDQVALGHRRLSIIDVASGAQPMSDPTCDLHLTFNGEIYNFLELRKELEALGVMFRSRSDTEVLLQAWKVWGEGCLPRLDGMFAFALWDGRQRVLWLARDRVGEKPLFWARTQDRFAFASEVGPLRAIGLDQGGLDPAALDAYFTLGYIPSPRSIHAGVRRLGAGEVLRMSVGAEPSIRRYWTLAWQPRQGLQMNAAVEEFGALLDEAVRSRMVSDVPLGAFLSGGLDSALVVQSMSRASAAPVLAHTIGFDDPATDESGLAQLVAQHVGANHRLISLRPDAVSWLPQVIASLDEPLGDSSALPTWKVCEMTRQHVTVALSGDGGDEIFGGYSFRYGPHKVESRIRAAVPLLARSLVLGPLGRLWPRSPALPRALRLGTVFRNLAVTDDEAYFLDLAKLAGEARRSLYQPCFLDQLAGYDPQEDIRPIYRNSGAFSALSRAQDSDRLSYMTDDVLVKVDRMSMSHALEVRCPLLSPKIMAFGASLPDALRADARQGKRVVRELARRRLPASIVNAPKKGFSVPVSTWLRTDLKSFAQSRLLGPDARVSVWLRPDALERIWHDHQRGARDHGALLWAILVLALWCESNRIGGH